MKFFLSLTLLLFSISQLHAAPITLQTPTGTLYGTLETPKTAAPWPVALIHAGSGPTNRDGDSAMLGGGNGSLRLLAEGLAVRGIASVRFDKRGVAASAAAATKEADLRFDTYIDDAVMWGQKLKRDRRFSSLTVIGHSEGSLIGMVAARKMGANAFVSIAGPGRVASAVLLEQLRRQLPPDMMKQTQITIDSLMHGHTTPNFPPALASLFRPSVQPYIISWFHLDPSQEIKKLNVPVLIAQGTTDLQVSVADARLLLKAKPTAKLCLIEGMNHVFKGVAGDQKTQMRSYVDPSLPVAPKLISEISGFINHLKSQSPKATKNSRA